MDKYKDLCIEIFGTDDIEKIRNLAKNYQKIGKKPLFDEEAIKEIKKERSHGLSINELAKKYNTSRQIISKYIKEELPATVKMRMTYMYEQRPCTDIYIDFINENIIIKNYTDDMTARAFGVTGKPTWKELNDFLEYRCFERTRADAKQLLKKLNLTSYDPLQIVEATKGKITDDNYWLRISYYD